MALRALNRRSLLSSCRRRKVLQASRRQLYRKAMFWRQLLASRVKLPRLYLSPHHRLQLCRRLALLALRESRLLLRRHGKRLLLRPQGRTRNPQPTSLNPAFRR